MLNNFSLETQNMWIHDPMCRLCKKRLAAELHHIYKRSGTKRNKLMDSPYNASPLCRECHDMGKVHWAEVRDILTKDTAKFLKQRGYKKTEKDKEFLQYIKTI